MAHIKCTKFNNSFLKTLTCNGNRYLHTRSVRFVDHLNNSYPIILKRKKFKCNVLQFIELLDNERVYPVLPSVVTNTPPPRFNTINYNMSLQAENLRGYNSPYTKLVTPKRKSYPGAEIKFKVCISYSENYLSQFVASGIIIGTNLNLHYIGMLSYKLQLFWPIYFEKI